MHRFNEEGPDGLTNREGAGRICLLNNRQMRAADAGTGADCRNRAGPEEHWESDGVVRWRRIDPVRIIDQRFGVACWQSVVSNDLVEMILLNDLVEPGFSHIPGRPRHPTRDSQVPGQSGD